MSELVGEVEYQVWRIWDPETEFSVKSECHVFERAEHALFFLTQLDPVKINEKGEAEELRRLNKVIRYKAKTKRKPTHKTKRSTTVDSK